MGVETSDLSADYVKNKGQFQLHTLVTEQRHPKTWSLSEVASASTASALKQLFSVDEDITLRLNELAEDQSFLNALEAAVEAAEAVLLSSVEDEIKRGPRRSPRIFFYGCGATGRLAKVLQIT